MLVPAGSPIFFLREVREHRFAVGCRRRVTRRNLEAVVHGHCLCVIHVEYVFIAHILIYILHKYWMCNSILPFNDVCNCL